MSRLIRGWTFVHFLYSSRIHVLQIDNIEVHWGIEDLKFLWRLIVEREPAQRNEDKVQQDKENIESKVSFISPYKVVPIFKNSEIQPAYVQKDQAEEKSQPEVKLVEYWM